MTTDGLTSFARTTLYLLEVEERRADEVSDTELKIMDKLVEILRKKGPMLRSELTHSVAPDYRRWVGIVMPKMQKRGMIGPVGERKARNGRVVQLWGLTDERAG